MTRAACLRRVSLSCLLLAALAFVLQPLAHAEHRLLMAFPELVAEADDRSASPADHQHHRHGHASDEADCDSHAGHTDTPMPICCDCTCGKLSEANAAPPPGIPPALAAAHIRPAIAHDLAIHVAETPFLRPLKQGPPLA